MKGTNKQNPVLVALAIIGACAILYGVWIVYQHHVVQEQLRATFSAPVPSGVPDILHAPPGPPPPQP